VGETPVAKGLLWKRVWLLLERRCGTCFVERYDVKVLVEENGVFREESEE
jgi:hypothetical protein